MAMIRSVSSTSLDYERGALNSTMDADICNMFGSLSLRAWAPDWSGKQIVSPLEAKIDEIARTDSGSDTSSGSEDATMIEITDNQGNTQFISASRDEPPIGCGFVHILASHFTPSACGASAGTIRDTDFNFLETILAHREAFIAFPYGHRTCSAALTNLACVLEHQLRQHQQGAPCTSGGSSDFSTVHALHNEAWLMSGWYSH